MDVGGFEGPLGLLLDLARRQKVDLFEISILALVEQYLAFIEEARSMRLELAADYLVMAAWLAYLKSRLLLPEPPMPDGPSATELATALAGRLRRLEAIRAAAKALNARPRLGRDLFARGWTEPLERRGPIVLQASMYDLLSAYAGQRRRRATAPITLARRPVWSLVDARDAVARLVGGAQDWVGLDTYLAVYLAAPGMRASVLASGFAAALEMVREGRALLRQDAAFAPLLVRRREPAMGAPVT